MALRLPSFRRRPESTHPRHRSITGAIQALLLAGFVILTAAACGEVGARPNNQGNEAYEQEDYEAAQSSYQEAIEKSPELPEPHYNSGNVRYRQGQNEEAQESYDRALLEAGRRPLPGHPVQPGQHPASSRRDRGGDRVVQGGAQARPE